ncbi:hypothetical protein PanWU01x14_276520, partial [Parasponia andersonii]
LKNTQKWQLLIQTKWDRVIYTFRFLSTIRTQRAQEHDLKWPKTAFLGDGRLDGGCGHAAQQLAVWGSSAGRWWDAMMARSVSLLGLVFRQLDKEERERAREREQERMSEKERTS